MRRRYALLAGTLGASLACGRPPPEPAADTTGVTETGATDTPTGDPAGTDDVETTGAPGSSTGPDASSGSSGGEGTAAGSDSSGSSSGEAGCGGSCDSGGELCGNGVVDEGEECDTQGCTDDCKLCGNGLPDPGEECDVADPASMQDCEEGCVFRGRRVFVSHDPYPANIDTTEDVEGDALDIADEICQTLAEEAHMPHTEGDWQQMARFRAWLSVDGESPATRFKAIGMSMRYVLRDGTVIAESLAELFDTMENELLAPIDLDQHGDTVVDVVWTGTLPGGLPALHNCANWTKTEPGLTAKVGQSSQVDALWTTMTDESCNAMYHIYCIEDLP